MLSRQISQYAPVGNHWRIVKEEVEYLSYDGEGDNRYGVTYRYWQILANFDVEVAKFLGYFQDWNPQEWYTVGAILPASAGTPIEEYVASASEWVRANNSLLVEAGLV